MMTRDVVCIRPDASLEEAWRLMTSLCVRHLPVLLDGTLCGIVSDRDLLLRANRQPRGDLTLPDGTISDAMTRDPVTCSTSATVSMVAGLMVDHRIDSIPIVDDGKLVGIVTSTDLIELLRTEPDRLADLIRFNLTVRRGGELSA